MAPKRKRANVGKVPRRCRPRAFVDTAKQEQREAGVKLLRMLLQFFVHLSLRVETRPVPLQRKLHSVERGSYVRRC